MRDVILGADGGGTKTNLIAIDALTGEKISSSTAGSIHVMTMGMHTAVDNMEAAICGLHLTDEDRILALAVGDPAIDDSGENDGAELIREIVARGLCPGNAACFSKSDVFMALYAFSKGEPAALIVAGTGSMGVALKTQYRHGKDNALLTVGGWGLPTTDAGSGYDIAVQGIRAAMDAFDEIAPPTRLCEEVQKHFGVCSPRALIDIFNGTDISRPKVAAFATGVDRCAQAGDAVAMAILTGAGRVLGKYGLSLLRHIEWPEHRLGIYGSVLLRNTYVQKVFADTIHEILPNEDICIPQHPPEYGAARFAADALNIQWEE